MSAHAFALRPFPHALASPAVNVRATLARRAHRLALRFALSDPASQVDLPDRAATPARKNNLWEETCFEFFVAAKNEMPYWEFNLAPSGHWNVYRFEAYRRGMREEARLSALPFTVNRPAQGATLQAEIDLRHLGLGALSLQVGVTTVVKLKNGETRYWAIEHCGAQPDFHLRESFIVEM